LHNPNFKYQKMALKLIPLASGSKGNSTLIMTSKTAILLDAGICYTKLCEDLKSVGLSIGDVEAVIITHEHADHIRALPKLGNRVYAHPFTARAIYEKGCDLKYVVDVDNYEGGFSVGDIEVQPFRIPHDAVYPLAYSFRNGSARCSVATDIGVLTKGVLKNVRESEVVLIEANHDLKMLKAGSYPPRLKARILSDVGHLSNDSAGKLARLLKSDSNVKHLILGHISENNNTEELAFSTVKSALAAQDGEREVSLHIAHQREISEAFDIE